MKQQKIYMNAWLAVHHRTRIVDTDQWYLDFANRLLPAISESPLYKRNIKNCRQKAAIKLALYMEDCVANGGNWRQFVHWHKEKYGSYLPFYLLPDGYLVDEINRLDVVLVIWAIKLSVELYGFMDNPLDDDILALADVLYEQMEAAFEEAPISDNLADCWFVKPELMEKECVVSPDDSFDEEMSTNVELFLKASGGEDLMYFDSYESLKIFLVQALQWEDNEDSLLPELKEFENFVLYSNPKGLLLGLDVAAYFADERNPLYNEELSKNEAHKLFYAKSLCPYDLLIYAMEHDLLPDAQFPFEDGKRILRENWDFVARWFLDDFYEGD